MFRKKYDVDDILCDPSALGRTVDFCIQQRLSKGSKGALLLADEYSHGFYTLSTPTNPVYLTFGKVIHIRVNLPRCHLDISSQKAYYIKFLVHSLCFIITLRKGRRHTHTSLGLVGQTKPLIMSTRYEPEQFWMIAKPQCTRDQMNKNTELCLTFDSHRYMDSSEELNQMQCNFRTEKRVLMILMTCFEIESY